MKPMHEKLEGQSLRFHSMHSKMMRCPCLAFNHPCSPSSRPSQVLVRLCDHIVVWAAQGLVRAAAAGRPALDQGELLRLATCRHTLAEALQTCTGQTGGSADPNAGADEGASGGMYERRLGFLDDVLELITVPSSELEGGVGGRR